MAFVTKHVMKTARKGQGKAVIDVYFVVVLKVGIACRGI